MNKLKEVMKGILKRTYLKAKGILSNGELNKYGEIYRTDKTDCYHSFAGKSYLDIYNTYMSPLKNSKVTMLEIGIRGGASLRAFRDYFTKGKIIGLDIDPGAAFTE